MPDTNINQIRQAEEEAKKVIENAQKKVEQNIGSAKEKLKNISSMADEKTNPVKSKIKQETEKAIGEYEKIADQECAIALEKLEETDKGKIKKAIDLIINKLTQ